MKKLTLGLSLSLGLLLMSFSQAAFAGKTIRVGPYGNTQTTTRTVGNGQQTTTRTGPNGRTQQTTRTIYP
jgi:hypothetical protein